MIDPLLPDDPRTVGRYRLEGVLGGGGMGRVYLGRSPGGRTVAVKVVRPELAGDEGFRRRFALEVEAARRVGGFYTAQVVDADPAALLPTAGVAPAVDVATLDVVGVLVTPSRATPRTAATGGG